MTTHPLIVFTLCLFVGACADEGDSRDSGMSPAGSTGPGPGGDSRSSDPEPKGETTGADEPTTGASSDVSSTGDGETGDDSTCARICAQEQECLDEPAPVSECIEECEAWEGELLEECRAPYEEVITCVTELSCTEFSRFEEGAPTGADDYPCKAQEVAFLTCESGASPTEPEAMACAAFCDVVERCDQNAGSCVSDCRELLVLAGDTPSDPCRTAHRVSFACIGGLECSDYDMLSSATEPQRGEPCYEEFVALEEACTTGDDGTP